MIPAFLRARRRTLFLKICLWFWVTTAFVGVTMVALDRIAGFFPEPRGMPRELETALRMYGALGMERHEAGDSEGLAKMTVRLREETGISAWLLDPAGVSTTGPDPTRPAQELAARARGNRTPEFSTKGARAIAAMPMTGPGGKSYIVLGEVLRPRRWMPGGPPGMPPGGAPPGRPPGPHAMWPVRLAVFFLVSGLICALLARYLTAPIVQLRNATRRLAGGDLSTRIGKKIGHRGDELSDLAGDFDSMAERIETLITMQRQLLGDISHELRSPLARLNVALELARRQTGEGARKSLDRIGMEADALNEMIAQVLTLTRLESGIEVLPGAPVELAHLVREVAENADYEAMGSGRGVRIVERTGSSIVSGDPELLARAVENVVRNAIRYEREGGTVEIRLRNTVVGATPSAEIRVRDHGQGVPEPELPNLFRPFYRVSNARERETGGTGLGLAITARAVRLHGGTVRATNAPEGGLLVEIAIPLLAEPAPDQSKSE